MLHTMGIAIVQKAELLSRKGFANCTNCSNHLVSEPSIFYEIPDKKLVVFDELVGGIVCNPGMGVDMGGGIPPNFPR